MQLKRFDVSLLWLWLACVWGSLQVTQAYPIVILRSSFRPHACAGVAITTQHVLVKASCVSQEELVSAFVLDLDDEDTFDDASNPPEDQTPVASVITLPGSAGNRLQVVTLRAPLALSPVTLPIQAAYPTHMQTDHDASILTVNLNTLRVTDVHGVTYINGSTCEEQVCALPAEIEARDVLHEPNQLSFLFKRDPVSDNIWLLGLGGDSVTNRDGIWGFSWLPQQLTSSSFSNLGVHGVQTVKSVIKEAAPPTTMSIYREFLVGVRNASNSSSFCTGSLISSRYVLTAAHCHDKSTIAGVSFPQIKLYKQPGEFIRVVRTVKHPAFGYLFNNSVMERRTYYFDLMLLELEHSTTRTPIKLITINEISAQRATMYGYVNNTAANPPKEMVYTANLPIYFGQVYCNNLLGISTLDSEEYMLCAGGQPGSLPCLNETSGGPLVLAPQTLEQHLLAIGSTGLACGAVPRYASYTRVTPAVPWINEEIKKVTAAPNKTKKPSRHLLTG
ncbi:hypothetical protein Poli38472_011477 [Pythium oligandrum]|uniref:Peptidase S1 domain-containing protein n=1 Tax=Pythium oligandrum TaxID=41045 RepID=A0A8K1CJH1_PYTOL|nr:hypothetical protein Poli38472_011477 [Pythium oligandrum]|eukprot:TMW64597.1 hypothetical protein Poli38472_011477 [Pythium oligandrum]